MENDGLEVSDGYRWSLRPDHSNRFRLYFFGCSSSSFCDVLQCDDYIICIPRTHSWRRPYQRLLKHFYCRSSTVTVLVWQSRDCFQMSPTALQSCTSATIPFLSLSGIPGRFGPVRGSLMITMCIFSTDKLQIKKSKKMFYF